MRRLLVAAFCVMLSAAALALPSIDEVQSEVRQGRWAHAEEMMREVVAAKPGSARAHYVYAEILAHDGRFDLAREEAAQARQLDPAIKFTDASKFAAFERLLEREQAAARRPAATVATPALAPVPAPTPAAPAAASSGLPGWVWAVGLALVGWLGWRMFAARRQAAPVAGGAWSAMPQGGGAMVATPGMGPAPGMGGYGMGAPSAGSGMLGTGLAVAGGVAAGMLAEKLLSEHHGSGSSVAPGLAGMTPGGFDTSALDEPAAQELEQRPVDFGQGDGWGGGADTLDAGGGSDGGW